MLWASVKSTVELKEGVMTWMEMRLKRGSLHGPLRIDIETLQTMTRLQLYIPPGHSPSPWSQIRVANHVDPHGLSEKCIALAIKWLQSCTNCEEQHTKCSSPLVPLLPTRVIYVGNSDQDIRLHRSEIEERSHYAALSHCWGGSTPIQTTLDRLDQYQLKIPAPLPQTFQDAVLITRALGIPYLWIDSLCIIQDSKEDWVGEAAGMASVYSNSLVTISADAATDSFTGFLSAPARTVIPAKQIMYSVPDIDQAERTSSIYVRAKGTLAQELAFHTFREENSTSLIRGYLANQETGLRSKLSTRGWVFQERILSPRTLHFSKYEMAWECQSIVDCECSTTSVRSKRTASILKGLLVQPREAVTKAWRDNIVPTYTSLDLTQKSDRLLAITGLATAIGGLDQSAVYVAGLWMSTTDELLWYISADEAASKSGAENVPSWSWAAVDGPVAFFPVDDQTKLMEHLLFQLQNVVESPSQYGTPAYRPSLLVSGLVIPVRKSEPNPQDLLRSTGASRIRHTVFISPLKGDLKTTAIYDSTHSLASEGPYYFLLMTTGQVGAIGLLLVQSGKDQDCFERVGLVADTSRLVSRVWRDGDSDWFRARREMAEKKNDLKSREKSWRSWKKIARKQTFKII
ncbi:HET-domain-containing protein [Cadophora sp. DSE1049]|nr:HET-domain-containing protein [Cadophora sp. DSE1049]